MFLFVGLGNPGPEYENNRHNIGFRVIDRMAEKFRAPSFRKKFLGEYAECIIDGVKCGLLKPQTFMNLSGQSVQAAMRFYKIPVESLFVFHDELDLPLMKMRVKTGGGAAGHNGLKSIDEHLGSQNYTRVRIGIGHPGDRDLVSNYVLSDFAKSESEGAEKMIEALADHSAQMITHKFENYMTDVARVLAPPKIKTEMKEE